MATILDISFLKSFDVVFVVLLVWTFFFALLQKTEAVSKTVGVNAALAAAVALLSLLSRTIIDVINFIVPWFAVAILFFFLMVLVFMVFGAKEADVAKSLSQPSLQWVLIGVGIVIILAGLGTVLGQKFLAASTISAEGPTEITEGGVATSNYAQNLQATLFHPKVIGLVVLFGVLVFAVALLTA